MASVKVASLLIKTISKPIANQIKAQAQEHESFKRACIWLAQGMHRSEVRLRTSLLGEPKSNVRPLIEAKAVANGATAIAEGFLLFVGVALIAGEAYRSSRSASKRRDTVDDKLEDLLRGLEELRTESELRAEISEKALREADSKFEHLASILSQIIAIGLKGGWLDPQSIAAQGPLGLPDHASSSYSSSLSLLPPFPEEDATPPSSIVASSSSSSPSSSPPSPTSVPPPLVASPVISITPATDEPPEARPFATTATERAIQPFIALQRELALLNSRRGTSLGMDRKKAESVEGVEERRDAEWEGYVEEMITGRSEDEPRRDSVD